MVLEIRLSQEAIANTGRVIGLTEGVKSECWILAVLRSSAGAIERLLWRKQTLKLDESVAISVKVCQMPVHIAMDWQSGARIRGQASNKP